MKLNSPIIVLFIVSLSGTVFGQPASAKLEGKVVDNKSQTIAGVRIVAPGGQAAVTDSKGQFTISFPASVQPGQPTRIKVIKTNWVIYHPMFGNCVTLNTALNYEPLPVIIVPKGSPLALSPKRLSQVIAQWSAERLNLKAEVGSLKQNLDESELFRRYANEYGFTLEQFRTAVDQWSQLKQSDDKEDQALKEYWRQNYRRAEQLFEESIPAADEELKQAVKRRNEASVKLIRRYQLLGNSRMSQLNFREALEAYNEIEKRFKSRQLLKEDFPLEWAEMTALMANAKGELGDMVEGEEGSLLLKESLADYSKAATVYTREEFPQQWAAVRNNMGTVLIAMGMNEKGPTGIDYLKAAVSAFRSALEVRTLEDSPEQWARTTYNVALTMEVLSSYTQGVESVKYMEDAVALHRDSLQVSRGEVSARRWASLQNHLGSILKNLSEKVRGKERIKYLKEAAQAYRTAIEDSDESARNKAPYQLNLANVLSDLGIYADPPENTEYLNEAVAVYQAALQVVTRKESLWASLQKGLGQAYLMLENLVGASQAYENVQTVEPDNEDAYQVLTSLYHENLFKFDEALLLHQQWLTQHPTDVSAQANAAEAYFSAGRFTESRQRINALLAMSAVPVRTKMALRIIEIAGLLADNQDNQVLVKIDALIAEVTQQPADFKVTWTFNGTRHFIDQNQDLSSYRAWFAKLFNAIERKNRDTMMSSLQDVRTKFQVLR
jgi:hypothetical protein